MINNLMEKLVRRIYPDELYCLSCGKAIDWSRPYGLCDSCMKNMKWASGRLCRKCGKLLSDNNPGDTCYNCRAISHKFNQGYSCIEYGIQGRSLVYALKYDEKPAVARSIGEIMADRMLAEFTEEELRGKYDLIVPVPVAEERLKARGYNQAALIAEYFAAKTGLPYYGEVLARTRETAKLKGMTPSERRASLQGSFATSFASLGGASCLVIDDIMTTGATADEVAEVLYASGAANVDFLSFASGADVIKS